MQHRVSEGILAALDGLSEQERLTTIIWFLIYVGDVLPRDETFPKPLALFMRAFIAEVLDEDPLGDPASIKRRLRSFAEAHPPNQRATRRLLQLMRSALREGGTIELGRATADLIGSPRDTASPRDPRPLRPEGAVSLLGARLAAFADVA